MNQSTAISEALPARTVWVRRLRRWGLLLILLDLLIGGTILGVQTRRWAWDYTQPARFRYDIGRNYSFGLQAIDQGYFNVYENQLITNPPESAKINYTPLRLALFGAWAKVNSWCFPDTYRQWQEGHDFNAFLMYYNTTIEWLAAIAAFLIVRHWVWRTGPPPDAALMTRVERLLYGSSRATVAFLLVWFSPAMIVSAHGWPSTDMWVVPFFLWAVLLASWEKWFLAGVVLGIGAMFKGQQLLTAPMFILWPLFAGQPFRAVRWVAGFLLAAAAVLSGWMLSYPADGDVATTARTIDWPAVLWVVSIAAALGIANLYRWLPAPFRWVMWVAPLAAAALVTWPAWGRSGRELLLLSGLAAIVIAGALWAKGRSQGVVVALVLAPATLLCMVFFNGTTGWYRLGFVYGTERHPNMIVGPGSNLPAILAERFGWFSPEMLACTIPAGFIAGWPGEPLTLTIKTVLFVIYATMLVVACVAIARQWRNNDRRFLVAIIVPWLLLYTIPAQMHERYLLYGATTAAIVAGVSLGMTALGIFLTILTALQTLQCMMMANGLQYSMAHPHMNADLGDFADRLRPEIGWAVIAITGVFFVAAFTRSRWRRPVQAEIAPLEAAEPELLQIIPPSHHGTDR